MSPCYVTNAPARAAKKTRLRVAPHAPAGDKIRVRSTLYGCIRAAPARSAAGQHAARRSPRAHVERSRTRCYATCCRRRAVQRRCCRSQRRRAVYATQTRARRYGDRRRRAYIPARYGARDKTTARYARPIFRLIFFDILFIFDFSCFFDFFASFSRHAQRETRRHGAQAAALQRAVRACAVRAAARCARMLFHADAAAITPPDAAAIYDFSLFSPAACRLR